MFKGWFGEKKTQFNLWLGLDSNLYQRFHDVIIPSSHGTTQIDHILVSPFGVFVVETKNYKGWIYGSEDQSTWTQVIYKSKHKFQNPLRQTHRHKKVLSKYLGIKETHIQTVISFGRILPHRTRRVPLLTSTCRLNPWLYLRRKRSLPYLFSAIIFQTAHCNLILQSEKSRLQSFRLQYSFLTKSYFGLFDRLHSLYLELV